MKQRSAGETGNPAADYDGSLRTRLAFRHELGPPRSRRPSRRRCTEHAAKWPALCNRDLHMKPNSELDIKKRSVPSERTEAAGNVLTLSACTGETFVLLYVHPSARRHRVPHRP